MTRQPITTIVWDKPRWEQTTQLKDVNGVAINDVNGQIINVVDKLNGIATKKINTQWN